MLPKNIATAVTEGKLDEVAYWLSGKPKPDLDARAVVAISVGDEVKAKVRATNRRQHGFTSPLTTSATSVSPPRPLPQPSPPTQFHGGSEWYNATILEVSAVMM